MSLLAVVRTRRWASFARIALTNPKVFNMICSLMCEAQEFKDTKTTLLHFVLRNDPPVEVVANMLKFYPDMTTALCARDRRGRTPLHVAALCGAAPIVVKLLSSANLIACTTRDEDGRTPLHLACGASSSSSDASTSESSCQQADVNVNQQSQDQFKSRSYDTLRAILSDSLESALIEDEDEMTALEYAIMNDAPIKHVTLLQKASMECNRRKQASGVQSKRRRMHLVEDNFGMVPEIPPIMRRQPRARVSLS